MSEVLEFKGVRMPSIEGRGTCGSGNQLHKKGVISK